MYPWRSVLSLLPELLRSAGSRAKARVGPALTLLLAALLCLAIPAGVLAAGGPSIQAGPTGLTLSLPGRAAPLIQGIRYAASDRQGLVFETRGAQLAADGTLTFALEGPGAKDASVTAKLSRREGGVLLEWSVRTSGPKREWNGGKCGLTFDWGAEATGVRTQPVVQWVAPTGAHPWEVAGDTPYPDTEWQLREVLFGDTALVMAASDYDPDWVFGGNKERARFCRLAPAKETPGEARTRLALLVAPARELDPDRLAAQAAGRPVALSLSTGRTGNLFAPGEPAPLRCVVSNVTAEARACDLELDVFSYQGERVLSRRAHLDLPANRQKVFQEVLRPKERGVLFVAARIRWEGGESLGRTTVGILPERKAPGPRRRSPFGMAAATANPSSYPDHFPLATVLPLMERIGVRWLRGGFYPLKAEVSAEEERQVRERVGLLRRHGIEPHVQLGGPAPKPEEVEAYQQRLAAALERFRWVSPYVEVGNELNLGGLSGADYVNRMLRPVQEVTRRVFPQGKVLSMGLGGVDKKWLDEFARAGGMELVDVLSVHPGCQPKAPEFWEGWRGWVFRSEMLDAVRAAQEHGRKEVWISEAYSPTPPGRSQVDLRTSADYLVRTYVCSLALGVRVIEWYQFQDGVWFAQRPRPDDTEYSYGIVYTDLTPKPAYVAYGALTEQLDGAECRGRLDLGADDLYGVRFQKEGRPVDVLWSYREHHETDLPWWPPEKYAKDSRKPGEPWVERWKAPVPVELPAAGRVEVTDTMGNTRQVRPENGKVSLRLTGSPVYVRGLSELPRRAAFWPAIP